MPPVLVHWDKTTVSLHVSYTWLYSSSPFAEFNLYSFDRINYNCDYHRGFFLSFFDLGPLTHRWIQNVTDRMKKKSCGCRNVYGVGR